MKKPSLLIATAIMAFACSTQDDNTLSTTANLIHTSNAFKSLGVSEELLDMQNIQTETTPSGHHVLLVSFKDNSVPKKIVCKLNDQGQITLSALAEIESSIAPENFVSSFDQKKFEGRLSLSCSTGDYLGMDFQQSKISNYFVATSMIKTSQGENNAAKTEQCAGWTEKGGPLDCAGASMEAEGPFSKAECYISGFIPCFTYKLLDCLVNGCVMQIPPSGYVVINGSLYPTVSVTTPGVITPTPVIIRGQPVTYINPITFQ